MRSALGPVLPERRDNSGDRLHFAAAEGWRMVTTAGLPSCAICTD